MEGNPGRRISAPRPRTCAVEAERCVACVSGGVARGAYTPSQRLSGRFSTPTGVLDVPGPVAPLWTIDLLVDDNDRDLGRQPIGIRLEDGAVVELGRTVLGLTTARKPVAHRPGQRPIPLGVGSLISHSHVGGCVP
jgi:hypothetical protein